MEDKIRRTSGGSHLAPFVMKPSPCAYHEEKVHLIPNFPVVFRCDIYKICNAAERIIEKFICNNGHLIRIRLIITATIAFRDLLELILNRGIEIPVCKDPIEKVSFENRKLPQDIFPFCSFHSDEKAGSFSFASNKPSANPPRISNKKTDA